MVFTIDKDDISGNKKSGSTLVKPLEQLLIKTFLPLIPGFIKTYHLTWASLVFSLLIIIVSFLARNNFSWLWLFSLIMIFQSIADMFDGEVGRFRKTGLIYWGFYMDHFLDFIFASAIIIGYAIVLPEYIYLFLLSLLMINAYFFHESLSCVVLGKYNVTGYYGVGGTELKLALILINTFIIVFGSSQSIYLFSALFLVLAVCLILRVYQTQKILWVKDIKKKGAKQ